MYVVSLLHVCIILWETVHYLCQISVHGGEDGNTHAEIACPEERLSLFAAEALHVVGMVFHPSCGAANHLNVLCERLEEVSVCGLRSGELYRHIGACKCLALEILLVIDVYNTYNLMATAQGNLLNHLSHLAIAYQCYFHVISY